MKTSQALFSHFFLDTKCGVGDVSSHFVYCSCSLGLFMSTVFYIASVMGIVLMYYLYASKLACSLNIFFITWTAVLLMVMMAISLHSMVCSSEHLLLSPDLIIKKCFWNKQQSHIQNFNFCDQNNLLSYGIYDCLLKTQLKRNNKNRTSFMNILYM